MPNNKTKVTGVVLAGGSSRRMGRDKALIEIDGKPIIARVASALEGVCDPVIIVGAPEKYSFLGLKVVPDVQPGVGAIMGIYTGLLASPNDKALVAACDMPFVDRKVVESIVARSGEADVVVPRIRGHLEPLLAVYGKACLPYILELIESGGRRIYDFYHNVRVVEIPEEEIAPIDPEFRSFRNLNSPEDLN